MKALPQESASVSTGQSSGRVGSSGAVVGAACGLLAAALFGASAPIAKHLLRDFSPVLLAGILYSGAALALWGHRVVRGTGPEARLSRGDTLRLTLVVVSGGIVAPVLMLLGLQRLSSLSGSLLLNLEAPLTVLVAVVLFKEHVGRYATVAIALILVGAAALKFEAGAMRGDTFGVLFIVGACFCWAIDNNVTQRLTLKDPFAIVRTKATVAGATNLVLGLALANGHSALLTQPAMLVAALMLGAASYGASVVLDAYALRLLGAAREAAYFATAPFVGVIVAIVFFGEVLAIYQLLAMASMAVGVWFLLRENHAHEHTHEAIEHEHLHIHDDHHQHVHAPGTALTTPHSHPHVHARLVHSHPHLPDAHHRHSHGTGDARG